MTEENKSQGFEIKDRRSSAGSEAAPAPEPAPEAKAETTSTPAEAPSTPRPSEKRVTEVTFTTFILSLSTSAFVSMGAIPDPTTGKTESNLEYAKQSIDILGMIKDKTKGNLQKEEEALLDGLLYDLRMKYLEKTNRIKL